MSERPLLSVDDIDGAEIDRLLAQSDADVNDRLGAIADEFSPARMNACMGCGCSDGAACVDGCVWVGPNLCSRCA